MNGILDDHLQKIEDFVLVEDKIVTYKWIAKVLKVHNNTAKQLLHEFTLKEEFRKKLLVTYLIAGKEKDNSSQRFCLVLQDELDRAKQSLGDIISQHVYSIQRNTNFNAKDLYNADCCYELNEADKKFCSIQKNEDIVKRKIAEPSVSVVESLKSCQNGIQKSLENNSKRDIDEVKSNSVPVSPPKEYHKKCVESISTNKEISKSPKKKKSPQKMKNNSSKGSRSISALFTKQLTNALNQKKEVPTVKEEKEEVKENLGKIINEARDDKNKNNSELDDSIIISTPVRDQGKQNNKKRKKRDKDNGTSNKRRKRIVVASDSESSDSDVYAEEYREPTPEPMEEEHPAVLKESDSEEIIPPTPFEKGKRKRIRREIDKTSTNDEGFFVTEKVVTYESCSDDETPSENVKLSNENEKIVNKLDNHDKKKSTDNLTDEQKIKNIKKSKKKGVSPKKTQQQVRKPQQTIMNFFKKK